MHPLHPRPHDACSRTISRTSSCYNRGSKKDSVDSKSLPSALDPFVLVKTKSWVAVFSAYGRAGSELLLAEDVARAVGESNESLV